ncbi:MAG: tRNA epoxyqueuosine(34) reductase QueG [Saprospiraceae bacterium]|nr:tRNA epoxyqueuosine(34) reductase QueG [Saprospiraceae bacterium]
MNDRLILTSQVKKKATDLGFSGVAIARAEHMDAEAKRLEQWLSKGLHGEMSYMANHFDLRVDPTKLVPGAKSVICLLYNYHTNETLGTEDEPRISRYAYGKDYHTVVRKNAKSLLAYIREIAGQVEGRCFVDSAPVLERDWAKRSGLGWVGKNTLLINPSKGSWFFLAEIICDLELDYDLPIKDYCGTCTRCIEACPTQAISADGYLVDGSRCISYLTIELKNEIPVEFAGKMDSWMFGCDVCQQVCPWNRFSTPHQEPDFLPSDALKQMGKKDWEELDEEKFNLLFKHTPIQRTSYRGLKRNLEFLKRKA